MVREEGAAKERRGDGEQEAKGRMEGGLGPVREGLGEGGLQRDREDKLA